MSQHRHNIQRNWPNTAPKIEVSPVPEWPCYGDAFPQRCGPTQAQHTFEMVGRAASLQKKHKEGFGLPMLPSKNGVGRVWFGRGSRPFKMKHGEEFAQHHLQMTQNRPNMAQYRPLRNLYDGNLKQAYSRV